MARNKRLSRVDRFAGLSDRAVPAHLSRIESPDLLNIDFSNRTLTRRSGFSRLTTSPFFDSSLRLNGYDSFARLPYRANYDPNSRLGLALHTRSSSFPSSETTLVSRGFGTGSSRFFQLSYDPTINTNLGGWRLRIYDAGTAAALQNVTLNDGDAAQSQVGQIRHLRLSYSGTANDYDFTVYDSAGASIDTTTITVQTWPTNVQDFILGCDSSDGVTIPAEGDASYYAGSMAEFMIFTGSTADIPPAISGRELISDANLDEIDFYSLDGYWKMNDGEGTTLAESLSSNDGTIGSAGAEWVTDQTKISGPAGIQFNGARGHIQVDSTNVRTDAFTNNNSTYRLWTLAFLFTPRLATGETTVRDQTLFWAGSDATGTSNPQPLGIRVVSDQLQFDYVDGTGLNTFTLVQSLASLVGVRCRVMCGVTQTASAEDFNCAIHPEGGTAVGLGPLITTTVSGNPTGTLAPNWSIGRKVNSYSNPVSFPTIAGSGGQSGYCWVDDFAFFKVYTAGVAPSGGLISTPGFPAVQMNKMESIFGVANVSNIWSMGLDDGVGHTPVTTGSFSSTAILLPEENAPFNWDSGLVEPDRAPEITLLADYRRFLSTGGFKRSILAISGTSLHEVDPSDGSFKTISGSLPKGGKWSHTQYADRVYMACNNGQSPIVYNGSTVSPVGIAAPGLAAVGAGSTTGGGGLTTTATYQIYFTYRNSSTGVESNPSPTGALTLAGTENTIDSIQLGVSPDPQVNQRRIWITAANAADGSAAFLSATIDDNATANYATDITALGLTPILDYTDNEQAPQGSVVEAWKDRLFVGGNTDFPTRVYYSSTPGSLEGFNTITKFEDADLDAGDPVVGLEVLRDNLIAYLRDGRIGFTSTGDATVPFFISRLNQDVGAVSEHSILIYENRHVFLGERDVWIWSGDDATNLSSPTQTDRPSVKKFIRDTINDAKKSNASVAIDRSRDTVWFAVATGSNTRNDTVLTLDISQGVWSKYDLGLDVVAEIEDNNDEPTLYGAAEGYILTLNTGNGDGAAINLQPSSGAVSSVTKTSAGWTVNAFKGLKFTLYDESLAAVTTVVISRNTADTIYLRTLLPQVPTTTDRFIVGGIKWYADFDADFGSTLDLKVLDFIKTSLSIASAPANDDFYRVIVEPGIFTQEWTVGTAMTTDKTITSTTGEIADFRFGGTGRTFRVRLTSSPIESLAAALIFPSVDPAISIVEFQVEAGEVSAR